MYPTHTDRFLSELGVRSIARLEEISKKEPNDMLQQQRKEAWAKIIFRVIQRPEVVDKFIKSLVARKSVWTDSLSIMKFNGSKFNFSPIFRLWVIPLQITLSFENLIKSYHRLRKFLSRFLTKIYQLGYSHSKVLEFSEFFWRHNEVFLLGTSKNFCSTKLLNDFYYWKTTCFS